MPIRRASALRLARGPLVAALVAALATPALPGPAPARAASDYPPGYTGFHTYEEMAAEVEAIAAAHPSIVGRFSIGRSHQGRELWAAKVSDNVEVDEREPEVLFDGLHHGNEPMSLEMTLAILRWLTEGYGTDPRITNIVDNREIWIVFAVNPDGQAYDYASGTLRNWRRNRQPTPGTTSVGTDLNRNYPYRWGGGGKTSANPASSNYRGPAPLSAPESRALRDFVAGRVVDGRQQITIAASFHEFGRKVMWPYAYTTTNVPAGMTADDRNALARLGTGMAAASGYRAIQASDLYVAAGTSADELYGRWRIFAYTFELSAVDYPRDTAIASETGRNREAVLRLMEHASCPLGVLGPTVRVARCGAFDDDLEVARGWSVNPDGTDTAPAGSGFVRGDPARTSVAGVTLQPTVVPSGSIAFVTGRHAGSSANAYDLDGRTSVRSPVIRLTAASGQRLTFRWLFAHAANASSADRLRAYVERADGSRTLVFDRAGRAALVGGTWRTASVLLDGWAGEEIRIRFEAVDGSAASTVEAGIDDVRVTRPG